jgi:hypothetical protein
MLKRAVRVLAVALAVVTLLSTSPRAQTNEARFVGKPEFSSGDALGYFIWKDGDTWKVRWTTFGATHRFNGRITIESGELRDFKRIDVDQERKVLAPGRPARVVRGPRGRAVGVQPGRGPVVATRAEDRIEQESERLIVFNTETDDDIDGLDFKVTGSTTVIRMMLAIDGRPRPAEVEVGRENFRPNENPVVIRLR